MTDPKPADWSRRLADYKRPHLGRSLFELALTGSALIALWARKSATGPGPSIARRGLSIEPGGQCRRQESNLHGG